MRLDAPEHVENTRAKIRLLEERYCEKKQEPGEMTQSRRLTMRSIRRVINGMIEDIVRYESRVRQEAARTSESAAELISEDTNSR